METFFGGYTMDIMPAVPLKEANRLPPDLSTVCSGLACNWRRSTTATFAKVYRGVVRGMIAHVDTFLSRFGQAVGRLQRRCGISISALHYTTNSQFTLDGGRR
jgi:hypothetical protein